MTILKSDCHSLCSPKTRCRFFLLASFPDSVNRFEPAPPFALACVPLRARRFGEMKLMRRNYSRSRFRYSPSRSRDSYQSTVLRSYFEEASASLQEIQIHLIRSEWIPPPTIDSPRSSCQSPIPTTLWTSADACD